MLTLLCGFGLCLWSLLKLRRRSLLVPTCSLFLGVGGVFILFAVSPNTFDRLSYMVGIHYPPILYLMGCIFALILMIIHLAVRISLVDERCRRLAQEIALLGGGQPARSAVHGRSSSLPLESGAGHAPK
jgi:hypothetical protein